MATKTIKVPVTLHIPGKGHAPFEWGPLGEVVRGKYVVDEVPPNTPVTLEAGEADVLLARYKDSGAVEIASAAAARTESGA